MKDFKQAAEETKKRLGVDLYFICDRKPGACRGWDSKYGWCACMNEMCDHTSNPDHAKYKNEIKAFKVINRGDGRIAYFENNVLTDDAFEGCAIDFSEVE